MSPRTKTSGKSPRPFLVQIAGQLKDRARGSACDLKADIMSIGRAENNDIVYNSESVSRCHAFFKRTEQGWLVQDTQSKNGIRVNQVKVAEKILQNGDLIQIGDFVFRFHDPAQNPVESTEVIDLAAMPPKVAPLPPSALRPPAPRRDGPPLWVGLSLAIGVGLLIGKLSNVPRTRNLSTVPAPPSPPTVVEKVPQAASPVAPRPIDSLLTEGKAALREGDYERALSAYRQALRIDPKNAVASEGERSAEFLQRELTGKKEAPPPMAVAVERPAPKVAPPPKKERSEKRRQVNELLRTAVQALSRRSYQEAIQIAERARKIELPKETAYLNEAKQIIDRARLKQREDVEPFLDMAKRKLASGDLRGAKDLCEEMVRTDPAFADAKECVAKANRGLSGGGH